MPFKLPYRITMTLTLASPAIVRQALSAVQAGKSSRIASARQKRSPNDSPASAVTDLRCPTICAKALSAGNDRYRQGVEHGVNFALRHCERDVMADHLGIDDRADPSRCASIGDLGAARFVVEHCQKC